MKISFAKSTLAAVVFFGLGAVTVPTVAAPGDWDRIDSVTFRHRDREQSVDMQDEGNLQRLAFRARDSDVRCQDIRISFANGGNQIVDGRRYGEDHMVRIDLNGDDRRITHIHFDCRPLGENRGRIVIYGK